MYCNKTEVNQLTSLLLSHRIRHFVVCPGSRNATIVHNLHQAGDWFCLHPVTDERSAAFVALGMALATAEPVGVCVTSGSALLGCIPAVAEAYYRHLPLLVISADRPQAWVNQYDGQTLPQDGALQPYCPTYTVQNPLTPDARWYNNRSINEALLSLHRRGGGPAHINVAIDEPMFAFDTEALPRERKVEYYCPLVHNPLPPEIVGALSEARLPVLLVGQYERGDIRAEVESLMTTYRLLVLSEIISDVPGNRLMEAFDSLASTDNPLVPDLVIHIGGNFVHKRFKQLLRRSGCRVIRVGEDEIMPDTFCRLHAWVQSPVLPALRQLTEQLPGPHAGVEAACHRLEQVWNSTSQSLIDRYYGQDKPLSVFQTLYMLSRQKSLSRAGYTLHLANSSTVRVAGQIFGSGNIPIYCNRGTNGIEGTLSTAVGYAMKMWGLQLVIIGDLSFFYDVNALWNVGLPANLRVLLLNNGHGSIFDRLPGLEGSPARDRYIAAGQYGYTASGVAEAFHLGYRQAENVAQLIIRMPAWLDENQPEAQLLEVMVTD